MLFIPVDAQLLRNAEEDMQSHLYGSQTAIQEAPLPPARNSVEWIETAVDAGSRSQTGLYSGAGQLVPAFDVIRERRVIDDVEKRSELLVRKYAFSSWSTQEKTRFDILTEKLTLENPRVSEKDFEKLGEVKKSMMREWEEMREIVEG